MPSHEGRGLPDFSTSFWKEFKLRYPRPAVYPPVGVAYLLLFSWVLALVDDSEIALLPNWPGAGGSSSGD
jgi:hypothetical protein